MKLTSFTDFGLRALILLAEQDRGVLSSGTIAGRLGLSHNHLAKILQKLAAAGFVRSLRGASGGVALARPASELSLGRVIRNLESDQPLVECFRSDGGACRLLPGCRLRGILAKARDAFYHELDQYTLADCLSPTLHELLAMMRI